ncbi:hypothetical protein D3C85_1456830 [compost metagenome]
MVAHEPRDSVRAVLTTRHGRIFGAGLGRLQQFGVAADHGLHAVVGVVLRLLQLFARQLAARDRVHAADVAGHVAVGDAAHFQRVQAAEVGDLLERKRGVVHQPDRGGLGHQDVGHGACVPAFAARKSGV